MRTECHSKIAARGDLVHGNYEGYVQFCEAFVAKGATFVGGCCGCGPAGIRAIGRALVGKSAGAVGKGAGGVGKGAGADRTDDLAALARVLAPTGVLRVGLNVANTLLVTECRNAAEAVGIAPALGAQLAKAIGVDVRFVAFSSPGGLADAVGSGDIVDVGFLAKDALRCATIAFSAPYAEIPCVFAVRRGGRISKTSSTSGKDGEDHITTAGVEELLNSIQSPEDVDQKGICVASFQVGA